MSSSSSKLADPPGNRPHGKKLKSLTPSACTLPRTKPSQALSPVMKMKKLMMLEEQPNRH